MRIWTYPARVTRHHSPTEETYLVTFTEFPEALTEGATPEEAEIQAADALATIVAIYLDEGMSIPPPRVADADEIAITLQPAMAARAGLASIMAEQRITKVALADRMGRDEKTIRKLLRPKGASLDLVMLALKAVGAQPMLSI